MVKKALILTAILIFIVIFVSVIISLINLKPLEFKSVVSYDTEIKTMVAAPVYNNRASVSSDLPLLTNMLKYEKTIMISSIILVIAFALLFYGAKRSKGW